MIESVFAYPKAIVVSNKINIENTEGLAVISILDTDCVFPIFQKTPKALTLWFDDISPSIVGKLSSCKQFSAMSSEQAKEIIDFVLNLKEENKIKTILVHCSAGICRSGAVAEFLVEILKLDQEDFKKKNPQIIPNLWVKEILWSTFLESQNE